MSYYTINKAEERNDRLKSGVITALVWSAILLFVFLYTVKVSFPKEKEIVTTMLINFGDNRNGNGEEEPANQEGSLAAAVTPVEAEPIPVTQPKAESKPEPEKAVKKETVNDKVLTGTDTKNNVKKEEKVEKVTTKNTSPNKNTATKSNTTNTKTTAEKSNSNTGSGDGQGTAAIGNLIKGRGTKAGNQGTGTGVGNAGDPLGGDGNGDSRIGVDRKLIGFIPGTMGRGGAQPAHNCTASGSITIAYTVDKAGNVVSAKRFSGSSDPCIVSTTTSWVKQYVKAEKANVSSTGTYKISF
ncbi:MAG: ferric siderophore ABC transporter substrate-binding protein [Bergeyella sp.]